MHMPPLPDYLVSVSVLICEKAIQDKSDNVWSFIRLVDSLIVPPDAPKGFFVDVDMFVLLKGKPDHDAEHHISVQHQIPDGTIRDIPGSPEPLGLVSPENTLPTAPRSLNVHLAVRIGARVIGTHAFIVSMDGQEVARAHLTLTPRATSATPDQPEASE